MSTAAGVAGFPAAASAKPTSPEGTSNITTASADITNVVAVPSTSTAVVTWTAYAGVGTVVTYSVAGGGQTCTATAPAVTCTLTGLTAGADITAVVTALDGASAPLGTTGSSNTFQVGAPAVPTAPTATLATDGSVAVSWTAPSTVGAGVDHYLVTGTPGGTCSTTAGTTATTCTVPAGLAPGTSHTFTVTTVGKHNTSQAVNNSAASAATTAVITALAKPTAVTASSDVDGTVTVGWTAPGVTTGIDHYTAITSPGSATCSSAAATPAATSCVISTGLTAGVAYTVTVRAVSASNHSAWTLPSPPAIIGPLYMPTAVMAQGGDGWAKVAWTAPTGFPANTISYYTVTGSRGDVCNTPDASLTTCTVTGLTNFQSSTFTVIAHTYGGTGIADSLASTASAAVTPLPGTITLTSMANSKFVTAESAGNAPLIANRSAANAFEKFWVVQNMDGTVSLKSEANNMYVSANPNGTTPLIANRSAIGTWEEFSLVNDSGSIFTLMAKSNGKYVTADHAGASSLIANRSTIGTWEMFTITAAS